MLRINGIKLNPGHESGDLTSKVKKILRTNDVRHISVVKKSTDARDKENIRIVYGVDVEVPNEKRYTGIRNVSISKQYQYKTPVLKKRLKHPPVVAGSGPAGLFASLVLAEAGCCPVVLERGRPVDERKTDVEAFWNTGILNPESNVQFGEGGAGTFSDGKLTTGINDPRLGKVLSEFVEAGAPEEIKYLSKPHIGTDKLIDVVRNIRARIISLGGSFRFETKLVGFHQNGAGLDYIECKTQDGGYELETEHLILAIGHSARDTIQILYDGGVSLEPKAFAVGLRIEHTQKYINRLLYGKFAGHPGLGPADYKLSTHIKNGRGVYTFCMCPGGTVVAAASEENQIAVNGMSRYARDSRNSNVALLVSVRPEDFGDNHPLAGISFQRSLEARSYDLGGGRYAAPVQLLGDFLRNVETRSLGDVEPSYRPGVRMANLKDCLDGFLVDALREGIGELNRKMSGFAAYDSVLTAVESRSSSPVRMPRDENYQSNVPGIMPCGEGAGYAGGIMSAAVDGMRCAEKLIDSVRS